MEAESFQIQPTVTEQMQICVCLLQAAARFSYSYYTFYVQARTHIQEMFGIRKSF